MSIPEFIARWQDSGSSERANYQLFLSELCDELDVPRPDPSRPDEALNPRKMTWPKADFIVGNPPFIGGSTMRQALGDGYVEAVRGTFKTCLKASIS